MLAFKELRIKDLQTFVASPEYLASPALPISRQRARSQALNPAAFTDDIALILVYENSTLRGYLGILPDNLMTQSGVQHVGWLSCIWVDDAMRGQGLAKKLVLAADKAWAGRLLLTEFTPAARQLYQKLGIFADLPPRDGLRLYKYADLARILPNKKPWLRYFSPLLALADATANLFTSLWTRWASPKLQLEAHFVAQITPELLINSTRTRDPQLGNNPNNNIAHNTAAYPLRGAVELQWIRDYPWLAAAPDMDNLAHRYNFSAVSPDFQQAQVELRDKSGQLYAFFTLTHRNGLLKMPYLYLEAGAETQVLAFVAEYMRKANLSTFLCYQNSLLIALKSAKFGFFWRKKQRREYMASQELAQTLKNSGGLRLQDGDGDAAFT